MILVLTFHISIFHWYLIYPILQADRNLTIDEDELTTHLTQVVKIVKDEMTELLGGQTSGINFTPNPPTVIMLVRTSRFW